MKIVKPSAKILKHNVPPYEFIERVGRTCYKSEDKITEGSAEKFVKSLVKSKHLAMLEHETIYLVTTEEFMMEFLEEATECGEFLKFFNVTIDGESVLSGSFRSFYEFFEKRYIGFTIEHIKTLLRESYPLIFGEFEQFSYLFKNYGQNACKIYAREDFINDFIDSPWVLEKHLTHTVLIVCDRGVSHEFVRHRPCSFAQESTRYCNYSKDKFGNEITVIDPFFLKGEAYELWLNNCEYSEKIYFDLLSKGATPQEARTVLPNSLKTELIITATEEEWQHIVDLRYKGTTGTPHPQMREVMDSVVYDLYKESGDRIDY